MWYCAHGIFYFALKYREQDSCFIHENVYLIEANNADEAMEKAVNCAKSHEDDNEGDTLTLNGEPVRYLFVGIRKLITVQTDENGAEPTNGCEVTYSELEVDTLEEVEKLANGDFVEILYRM